MFTGLWEGGNNTCTKSSKDAELGGFGNTREDREVRKICRKTQRPNSENGKQIHLEGTGEGQQHITGAVVICILSPFPLPYEPGGSALPPGPRVLQSPWFTCRNPLLVCGSRGDAGDGVSCVWTVSIPPGGSRGAAPGVGQPQRHPRKLYMPWGLWED